MLAKQPDVGRVVVLQVDHWMFSRSSHENPAAVASRNVAYDRSTRLTSFRSPTNGGNATFATSCKPVLPLHVAAVTLTFLDLGLCFAPAIGGERPADLHLLLEFARYCAGA